MSPLRRRRPALKNLPAEAEQFRRRAFVGAAAVAVALLALAFAYFRLQVLQHDEYETLSERNRIKAQPIVPARGLIYDRAGRLLADNIPAYRLEVVPEQAGDPEALVAALREVVALDEDEIARFHAQRRASRGFRAVPLKLRLDEAEVARFAVERHRFPGVEVVPYLTRRYPYGPLMAHVVGYVGRVDAADLERMGDSRDATLTLIGKGGLERRYEDRLRGEIGFEMVERNVQGRVLRVLERVPATPGQDLHLSIDAGLQQAIVDAFDGQHGAAVAIDPATGEVLAMVSVPSFDPNLFVGGISHAAFAALNEDPGRPLFNRVLAGGFPPGSTIKPFMAMAGLEQGLITPTSEVLSTGAFRLPGQAREYRDWRPGGHGRTNLRESLAQSVNTYYFDLAHRMGPDRLEAYMRRLGFGAPTGIDLLGEARGVVPGNDYARGRFQRDLYPGENVISGIGQGFWVVTPLQLAQATAALSTGVRHVPHLLRATEAGFGSPRLPEPQPPGEAVVSDPAHVAAVRDGLEAVMHGPTGTARGAAGTAVYRMAGKTGTAQRVSRQGDERLDPTRLPYHLRHQALFVGYAPVEAPEIAIAVVVEHGGSGSAAAAPVARRVFDAWLLRADRPGGPYRAPVVASTDAPAALAAPATAPAADAPSAAEPPPATEPRP